jgi:predicted RNA binding protein YcfA (HicA-like mRNA interferase family)
MPNAAKLTERLLRFPITMRYTEVFLEAYGWELERITGSHHIFVKPGQRIIDVVVHDKVVKIEYLKMIADRLKLKEEGR